MKKLSTNSLRTHRRNSGVTLSELAKIVGYRHAGSVLRHETSRSVPPLHIAFRYEVVFRVPVARMFSELRNAAEENVEEQLEALEQALGQRSATDRNGRAVAQKLMWLSGRKNPRTISEPLQ